MNAEELNQEVYEYIIHKIIKKHKKEFKQIKATPDKSAKEQKWEKAIKMLQEDMSIVSILPEICKYIDKHWGSLRNSFKRRRAVAYLMYLQEKLKIPQDEKYTAEQADDLVDLVISSGRFYFNYNVNKLNTLKDIGSSLARMVALLVPFARFFR